MTSSRSASSTFSFTSTFPRASTAPRSRIVSSSIARPLLGILVRGRVRDQLRARLHQDVDDLHPVASQGRAGLGQIDDRVDDLGHLRLGRAVGEEHPHGDTELLEVGLRQVRELGRDPGVGLDVLGPMRSPRRGARPERSSPAGPSASSTRAPSPSRPRPRSRRSSPRRSHRRRRTRPRRRSGSPEAGGSRPT